MNRRQLIVSGFAASGMSSFPLGFAQTDKQRRILFFTKSSGFEHPVITQTNGQPSHAEKILAELGAKHGFEVTTTKDGGLITAGNLAKYDAVFFQTTGDLCTPGNDKHPPISKQGKTELLEWIRLGHGFLGAHNATDTYHTEPDDGPDRANRYQNHGEAADPYVKMIGAEFIKHGPQQTSKLRVIDPKFPGFNGVKDFDLHEEWYSLKDFQKNLHVLLVQETAGMKGPEYARAPYPATWARSHGRGRVFYTSMGHREDVWSNPIFQQILLGGLAWAVGNLKADVTPNLEQAAPGHAEIPPMK